MQELRPEEEKDDWYDVEIEACDERTQRNDDAFTKRVHNGGREGVGRIRQRVFIDE